MLTEIINPVCKELTAIMCIVCDIVMEEPVISNSEEQEEGACITEQNEKDVVHVWVKPEPESEDTSENSKDEEDDYSNPEPETVDVKNDPERDEENEGPKAEEGVVEDDGMDLYPAAVVETEISTIDSESQSLPGFNERNFQCPICLKRYTNKAYLSKHIRFHEEGDRKYQCDICFKQFFRRPHLLRHRESHNSDRNFQCPTCLKTYASKEYLKRHLVEHTGTRSFPCPLCDKKFFRGADVTEHLRSHATEKRCTCQVCGKGFPKPCKLKMHMRIHTGERNYVCEICKKTFRQNSHLKAHVAKHSGQKFSCPVCNGQFTEKGTLKKHMNIHTGDLKFQCEVCNKRFNSNSNLKEHLIFHTGQKNHQCPTCLKKFSCKSSLRKHRLTICKNGIPPTASQASNDDLQKGKIKPKPERRFSKRKSSNRTSNAFDISEANKNAILGDSTVSNNGLPSGVIESDHEVLSNNHSMEKTHVEPSFVCVVKCEEPSDDEDDYDGGISNNEVSSIVSTGDEETLDGNTSNDPLNLTQVRTKQNVCDQMLNNSEIPLNLSVAE
ncbi:zinc finger protein 358-like isoform X1 [Anabrus simplex]|uniref:zinc finger protein 358-like isoform X1 n=2 Tax=Anabrus simplex TaxID=316456 RepID=UPI0035A39BB8